MEKDLQIGNISLVLRNGKTMGLSVFVGEMSRQSVSRMVPFLGKEIKTVNDIGFNGLEKAIVDRVRVCNMIPDRVGGVVYSYGTGLQHRNIMRFDVLSDMVRDAVIGDIGSRLRIMRNHKHTDFIPKWFGDNRSASDIQADLDSVKTGKTIPVVKPINVPGKSISYKLKAQFEIDSDGEVHCEFIRVPIIDGVAYVKKVRVKNAVIQKKINPFGYIPAKEIPVIVRFGDALPETEVDPDPVFKLVEMTEAEIREKVLAKELSVSVSYLRGEVEMEEAVKETGGKKIVAF